MQRMPWLGMPLYKSSTASFILFICSRVKSSFVVKAGMSSLKFEVNSIQILGEDMLLGREGGERRHKNCVKVWKS